MRGAVPTVMLSVTVVLRLGAALEAQELDRIYVDQYMPLRSELMIADANGSNPRKLVPGTEIDYNASFSYDGQWVVVTSDRSGSADIYRVRVDGRDLERLTDSPAFDDQAALSPDNRSLAFVSSRGDGSTDIYIMDLERREVRNLTTASGGDFRPSWSPDGQTIAFSSDRGTGFPHQDVPDPAGKWEHVQAASLYVINTDGTGLRKLTAGPEMMAGSPRWSPDGSKIVFYEMLVRDTFRAHFGGGPSSIVSVDVATGERTVHASGPGLKVSPQFIAPDRVAYLIRARRNGILAFTNGEKSAPEDLANPSWSHDGTRVVYHARPVGDDAPLLQHAGAGAARHRGGARPRAGARERLAGRVARRPHARRERANAEQRPDGAGHVGCRRHTSETGVSG